MNRIDESKKIIIIARTNTLDPDKFSFNGANIIINAKIFEINPYADNTLQRDGSCYLDIAYEDVKNIDGYDSMSYICNILNTDYTKRYSYNWRNKTCYYYTKKSFNTVESANRAIDRICSKFGINGSHIENASYESYPIDF